MRLPNTAHTSSPRRINELHARMRSHTAPTVRWQRDVPRVIRSLDTLARCDYSDTVTATVSETPGRSPKQSVGSMLEGVPAALRLFIPYAQGLLLCLRLELRPSPKHPLGWKIADRGGELV